MGPPASNPAGTWATTPATPLGRSTGGLASRVATVHSGAGGAGAAASGSMGTAAPGSIASMGARAAASAGSLLDATGFRALPHAAPMARAMKTAPHDAKTEVERRTAQNHHDGLVLVAPQSAVVAFMHLRVRRVDVSREIRAGCRCRRPRGEASLPRALLERYPC